MLACPEGRCFSRGLWEPTEVTSPFSWKQMLFQHSCVIVPRWVLLSLRVEPLLREWNTRKKAESGWWENNPSTNLALKTLQNLISWEPIHHPSSRSLLPSPELWFSIRAGEHDPNPSLWLSLISSSIL